jgi:hypothetical protein
VQGDLDAADVLDDPPEALEAGHHPVVEPNPGEGLEGSSNQARAPAIEGLVDPAGAVAGDVDPRIAGKVQDAPTHGLGVDADDVQGIGPHAVGVADACIAADDQDEDLSSLGLESGVDPPGHEGSRVGGGTGAQQRPESGHEREGRHDGGGAPPHSFFSGAGFPRLGECRMGR